MSDEQEKVKIGDYVELKPGFEQFWPQATPAAQGLIADAKTDDDGFDLVYVKWNHDHWKFNGQQDGWTYATHFNVLDTPNVIDNMIEKAKERVKREDEEGICPSCGVVHTEEERENTRQYLDLLTKGAEIAAFGDAFLLVAMIPEKDPVTGRITYVPMMSTKGLTSEATVLLENQLVQLAALAFQDYALDFTEEEDEPRWPESPNPEKDS